jgi:membrane dipeptidase
MSNNLNIDLKKISEFKDAILFLAIWLDDIYLDRPFENTIKIIDFFYDQKNKYKKYFLSNKHKFILSIEGGEALENNVDNLDLFYDRGVRLLTLTWNRENNLAGGCYCSKGLKKFGYEILERSKKFNILIDISHASKKTFWDIYNFNNKNILATHSNSKTVYNHIRNLDDDQILAIKSCNSIIGLNLFNEFLTDDKNAQLIHVIKQVEHFLKLNCENNICLGCDFDGVDNCLPVGIKNILDINKIYHLFKINFGKIIADKIFYFNAKNFLKIKEII